jgi:hypothetical protein
MRNAGFALFSGVALLVGAAIGWIAKPDGGAIGSGGTDERASAALAEVVRRLDEVAAKLDALEAQMRVRSANSADPAVAAAASNAPVRTEAPELRAWLETRLSELSEQIRRSSAGLGEAGKLKPAPDLAALRAFQKESSNDAAAALRRITGMTYRDATLEFGVPTQKQAYDNVRGPTGGKLIIWLWQASEDGFEMIMSFENDAAVWTRVGRLGALKEYVDHLGKEK